MKAPIYIIILLYIGALVEWSNGRRLEWSNGLLVERSIGSKVEWSDFRPFLVEWSSGLMIEMWNGSSIGCMVDWFNGWIVDWFDGSMVGRYLVRMAEWFNGWVVKHGLLVVWSNGRSYRAEHLVIGLSPCMRLEVSIVLIGVSSNGAIILTK